MKKYLVLVGILYFAMPVVGMDDKGLFPFIEYSQYSPLNLEIESLRLQETVEAYQSRDRQFELLQKQCDKLRKDIASCDQSLSYRMQQLSIEQKHSAQLHEQTILLRNENKQLEDRNRELMLNFGNTLRKLNMTKEEWQKEKEIKWKKEYDAHVALHQICKAEWESDKNKLNKEYEALWNKRLEELNQHIIERDEIRRQHVQAISDIHQKNRVTLQEERSEFNRQELHRSLALKEMRRKKTILRGLFSISFLGLLGYFIYVQRTY